MGRILHLKTSIIRFQVIRGLWACVYFKNCPGWRKECEIGPTFLKEPRPDNYWSDQTFEYILRYWPEMAKSLVRPRSEWSDRFCRTRKELHYRRVERSFVRVMINIKNSAKGFDLSSSNENWTYYEIPLLKNYFPALNPSHRSILSLVDFPSSLGHLINYVLTEQARSVLQDLGLNILLYEKQTRLINSKICSFVLKIN